MAALLFEYLMPGMRRVDFPSKHQNAMSRSTRYKSIKNVMLRFQTVFSSPFFAEYVIFSNRQKQIDVTREIQINVNRERQDMPESALNLHLDPQTGNLYPVVFPNHQTIMPSQLCFRRQLLPEYRTSFAVFDWLEVGSARILHSNIRDRRAAILCISATDETRRDAFLETEHPQKQTPLVAALKDAYGRDYPMRIAKRLKRLLWLCENPFRVPEKEYNKRYLQHDKFDLDLRREDAKYMMDLLDIEPRIPCQL